VPRLFWLGVLTSAGRQSCNVRRRHPLRRLIDAAFVLPPEPAQHRRRVLKGVHPGIGEHDRVILWYSGIWNWFDPLTLVRAMARIVPARPEVKLYFTARTHFDSGVVPEQSLAGETVALARELGLLDRHIFFGDWAPYDERENYLLEADLGVSLHYDHVETRFAVRTRLIDFFWAGLPMVVTRGDVWGDMAAQEGVARAVDAEDVDGVAAAILGAAGCA
jgi:glycosyltransferase involved in cell wall biosynthesis